MTAEYPGAQPTFVAPNSTLGSVPLHSQQHIKVNEELAAICAELGISPSGGLATVKARLDSMPAQELVYVADDTGTGGASADEQDVPGLVTGSFTPASGRVLDVTWALQLYASAGGPHRMDTRIVDTLDGDAILGHTYEWSTAGSSEVITKLSTIRLVATGSAMNLKAVCDEGSGTGIVGVTTSQDSWLWVRDMGTVAP